MLNEVEVLSCDVTEAIAILELELSARINNGDGPIEGLTRIIEALGEADRILIV